jgi:hypothetical protein
LVFGSDTRILAAWFEPSKIKHVCATEEGFCMVYTNENGEVILVI